ncbi:neuropeptides B/W receptor type 2-like [Convolutriloba macropyga]|uniref:neuropeptides B/W receptor type 2-like n=1 Tax=Convolutriloba macropyga TaxID=536237 RepID=UPI003F51BAD8
MPSPALAPAVLSVPLIGITLNAAILLSLLRKSQLRKIANIFFFNQALADVLFLSLLPFIIIEYYLQNWPFGEIACQSLITLDSMNQFSSVFLLTVMSVDRYLSLSRPLSRIQFRTKRYAWMLSAATWMLACLLCCPLWFFSQSFGNEDLESEGEQCYFLESEDAESAVNYKLFTVYAFLLGFVIPLLIISAANYSILGHINRNKNTTDQYQPRVHRKNATTDLEKRKRTCIIVIICTIIFAICCYCNGMLNPLVLLIMSSSVRENLINFRKGASNTDISQTRFHRGASYSHSVPTAVCSRSIDRRAVGFGKVRWGLEMLLSSGDNGGGRGLDEWGGKGWTTGRDVQMPRQKRVDGRGEGPNLQAAEGGRTRRGESCGSNANYCNKNRRTNDCYEFRLRSMIMNTPR